MATKSPVNASIDLGIGVGFGIGGAGILLGERLPLGGIGSSEMLRFPQGLEILGDPRGLSTFDFRPSTVNYQLSIINYQFTINPS